jgi:hypothetical protein
MDMEIHVIREPSGRLHVRRSATPPSNPQHIDVSDPAQIARWCREFGCTWLELFSAIDRAGTNISAVRSAIRTAAYR